VGWTTEVSSFLLSSCGYGTSKKSLGCVDSVSGYCVRVPADDHSIMGQPMVEVISQPWYRGTYIDYENTLQQKD